MRPDRYDAVIAGGGLSGMSLAAHLGAGGWRDRSVLIVDDATASPDAVCWGSWAAGPRLLDAAVSRTYRQVRVSAAGVSRVVPLGNYRYQVVHRPDLRRAFLRLVDDCPRFVVRAGRVEQVRDGVDAAEAVVDGERVRGRWLFDSVTVPTFDSAADAHLAFTGWEVRCERPVFDPETPTLFDFRTPQAGAACFVYVLPDGPCRALVELTEFVPRHGRPRPPAARGGALAEYLRDVTGGSTYRILRVESAVLPPRTRLQRRRSGHVLAIGARGGLVKASTGYAYQRIQRDSAAIAASLTRCGHPFDLPRPRRRHPVLDAVLLDVLDRQPAQLERAFARLFLANPAERVLRFLDEETSVRDELRLIASLPPLPYMRAAATRVIAGMWERRPSPVLIARPPPRA